MKYIKKNQVPTLTLKAFNNLYKKGYDKMYPDINLVRIEKVFLKKKGLLLDFGCGPGQNGLHFLKAGYKVCFTDISDVLIRRLKKKKEIVKNKNFYKIVNTAKESNFFLENKNKFNYIICMSVFNNFESKNIANFYLKNFYYILKKGGKLIIDSNLDNKHNYKKIKKNNKIYYLTNPNNKNLFKMFFPKTQNEFVSLIKKTGFKIKDVGYSNFKVFSNYENEVLVSAEK